MSVTAQSAIPKSLLTPGSSHRRAQTDTVTTQEPTSTYTYTYGVTPRDIEITFNIMDRDVASFTSVDTATLLAATAYIAVVPAANVQLKSLTDATFTGARRLDTQMIAVTEYVTASPVSTSNINAAVLAGYTGFVIDDFVVTEKLDSSTDDSFYYWLFIAFFGTMALQCIIACACDRRNAQRNANRGLAPKPDEEKVSEEAWTPVCEQELSGQILPAPFAASDMTILAQAIAAPNTIDCVDNVTTSYTAQSSYEV